LTEFAVLGAGLLGRFDLSRAQLALFALLGYLPTKTDHPARALVGRGHSARREEAAAEVIQVAQVMAAAEAKVLALHLLRQVVSAANARDKVPRATQSLQ
jgi:hypothetical protein